MHALPLPATLPLTAASAACALPPIFRAVRLSPSHLFGATARSRSNAPGHSALFPPPTAKSTAPLYPEAGCPAHFCRFLALAVEASLANASTKGPPSARSSSIKPASLCYAVAVGESGVCPALKYHDRVLLSAPSRLVLITARAISFLFLSPRPPQRPNHLTTRPRTLALEDPSLLSSSLHLRYATSQGRGGASVVSDTATFPEPQQISDVSTAKRLDSDLSGCLFSILQLNRLDALDLCPTTLSVLAVSKDKTPWNHPSSLDKPRSSHGIRPATSLSPPTGFLLI